MLMVVSWNLIAQEDALFKNATTDYNEGRYEEAAAKYEEILEGGKHSAALYYNLGNTYYKLNRIAPSIYYYEKALLLDPGDPEIRNNLAFAKNMTLDDIAEVPQTGLSRLLERTTGLMTFDQWAYLAVVFIFLFVFLYIAYYYLRYATQKRLAFTTSLVLLFLSLFALVFAYIQFNNFKAEQPAIIFAPEVAVKSEPNDRSEAAFVLHEGTKVQVLEQLNEWKRIQLADGSTGWIPQDALRVLKDF